jgi:hypothetical protein
MVVNRSSNTSRAEALSSTTSALSDTSREGSTLRTVVSERPNQPVKLNVLPPPGLLTTQIEPPINSTRRLEMAKPNPVPSAGRSLKQCNAAGRAS